MTRKNCPVRVDRNTRDELMNLKRELQVLENKELPLGEIIRRMSKGEDIKLRLKEGALERRHGKK